MPGARKVTPYGETYNKDGDTACAIGISGFDERGAIWAIGDFGTTIIWMGANRTTIRLYGEKQTVK